MRKHLQGIAERDQIPGIGRLVADPPDETFQIIDGIQILTDFLSGNVIHIQFFHRLLAFQYLCFMYQRLFNAGTKQSGPHGRLRLV